MFCYPVAPFQGDKNGKRRAYICFSVTQCKWKETLTSAFGRFDTYTALLKREQVENDVRRRILQSIPDGAAYYGWCGIASKTIDFLLQFILQQPLLSQLTITVRGHWSWWSHLFVGNILHCTVAELELPNMGIENWWRPFSQVVSHQMGEGF